MSKILIIEDDEAIRMALEDDLTLEGFQVQSASDGEQGLMMAQENCYDLIILDLMLPRLDGIEVCKELRKVKISTPIIMLTAKSQELDKIIGLELGADDYVTKPFSPRELLARIKAILRRARPLERQIESFQFGDVEVNFQQMQTTKRGEPVYLTALEYELLHFFIDHKNEVVSRDLILDQVWGEDVFVTSRTVDTHVANLRRKIEDDLAHPKFIVGVRGAGYKLMIAN